MSRTKEGYSAINNIKMSPVGEPCVNPWKTDKRANGNGAYLISRQQSDGLLLLLLFYTYFALGCGELGSDDTFSEVLFKGNEYEFYKENNITNIIKEYPEFLPDYFD